MPDAATIEAARPCCPECGHKLTRTPPRWSKGTSKGWTCTHTGLHNVRVFADRTIAERVGEALGEAAAA